MVFIRSFRFAKNLSSILLKAHDCTMATEHVSVGPYFSQLAQILALQHEIFVLFRLIGDYKPRF